MTNSPLSSLLGIFSRIKRAKNTTQRYLPIAEIRNNTVLLKGRGLRGVLRVEAINFALKSEGEQKGIIAGYGNFLNTLTFPIQIIARSTRIDLDAYLSEIEVLAEKQENTLLKEQTEAYGSFVSQIINFADIMQKEFYIVIPLDRSRQKKTVFESFLQWMNVEDSARKMRSRRESFLKNQNLLSDRIELVESGLENIGLKTSRLKTMDLIKLFYRVYNPEGSLRQKLPEETGALSLDQTVL